MTEDPTPVRQAVGQEESADVRPRGRSGGANRLIVHRRSPGLSPQNGLCGQAFPFTAQDEFGRHDTSRQRNTHSTESREVRYPWHPWHDRVVTTHRSLPGMGVLCSSVT